MQVEISLVIAAISLIFSVYVGVSNLKKSNKADTAKDTTDIITVIVKLENISLELSEIKSDLKASREEGREQSLKIAKMEQQIKALEKVVFATTGSREGNMVIHEN